MTEDNGSKVLALAEADRAQLQEQAVFLASLIDAATFTLETIADSDEAAALSRLLSAAKTRARALGDGLDIVSFNA